MSHCIFCKQREATWTSPTGHVACVHCRFSELDRVFRETYWMLLDIREQLDRVAEWIVEKDGTYADRRDQR